MAVKIKMKHPSTGIIRDGIYGFSWTTLFFGMFPALFRGDFVTFVGGFVVLVIVALATAGVGAFIAMFIWAFFYNAYYTKKLIESGYVFAGSQSENESARMALNIESV